MMLGTGERLLLVDTLAPPDTSFRLDRAVATTFTLDLMALLPIPLAFAGRDLRDELDPLAALQAIRHYADRIDVYSQAGHIHVDEKFHSLLAFLEPIVHPIAPPPGHLFHPKVWVVRYTSTDSREPDRFRFVCGSRNLTNDRAWDAVVSLEGVRGTRNHALNRPVAEFVSSLPGRAQHPHPNRAEAVQELAEDLRTVVWDSPPDCDSERPLAFHVFGPQRRAKPNLSGTRRLVVAPFLNDVGVDLTCAVDDASVAIISRPESFDALAVHTKEWIAAAPAARCYVLNDSAAIPEIDSAEAGPRWSLSGLHAKIYVAERDRRTHVFIGSANATDAAWQRNDEILVEIVGRRRTWGIDSMVPDLDETQLEHEDRDEKSFRSVLLEYEPGESAVDDELVELEAQIDEALRALAAMPFGAIAQHVEGEVWSERVTCSQALVVSKKLPAPVVRVGLLSTPAEFRPWALAQPLEGSWELPGVDRLTPFVVVEVGAGPEGKRISRRTVVIARLTGDPDDRLDRILARQFTDRDAFLRFLMLLLALAEDAGEGAFLDLLTTSAGSWSVGVGALLESLVKALASNPAAIDDVAHIVGRLHQTEDGRALLPDGWHDLWAEIERARALVRRHPEDRA